MGNSFRVPLLGHSGSLRFPCHLQLPSAAIDLSTDVTKKGDGTLWEDWNVLYTIEGSSCCLKLTRHVDEYGNIKDLSFFLTDNVHLECGFINFTIDFSRTRMIPGRLVSLCWFDTKFESAASKKTNRTVNAWGRYTETTSYVYGRSGNRGGLIVQEWKKNSKDEPFTTFTSAHYFAFNKSTQADIGFSVVAKLRVSDDGKLDATVDGPEQHPAFLLLYVFDEVIRTGIWKPTMCFHCAQNRRHLRRMVWHQFECLIVKTVTVFSPHHVVPTTKMQQLLLIMESSGMGMVITLKIIWILEEGGNMVAISPVINK